MARIKKASEKKILKAFGLRVRQMRNQRGWTLEQAEEQGWPSWRHLQKIEAGKNITLITVYNLASLFGVDAIELLP